LCTLESFNEVSAQESGQFDVALLSWLRYSSVRTYLRT